MEINETYDLLKRIHRLDMLILCKEQKAKGLRSRLYYPPAIVYDKDKVQTSPRNTLEETEAKIMEIEACAERMREERDNLVDVITAAIEKVQDEDERTVLMSFYIGRMTMQEIADVIYMSRRTVYYIRKKGVRRLAELL